MSIFSSLPTFQSNAFLPQADKFDMARAQANTNAWRGIFSSVGRLGQSFAAAWKARDYEKKAEAARQAAYRNAQIVAQAQMESNLKLAQYESDRRIDSARVLESNIPSLMKAAEETRERGRRMQAQQQGQVRARYASSGVQIGTGSARLVLEDVLRESDISVDNQFQASMNQIRDTANAAARERLEAQFAVWSAEEQNRFISANVQQRLG